MTAARGTALILGIAAVLLGIAAIVHNYNMDQVGWNTVFAATQTIITAILMAVVAIDGTSHHDEPAEQAASHGGR